MIVNQAEELYTSRISFTDFDALAIDEAKKRFYDLQSEGIIKNDCSFEDAVWHTTDEYANIGLHFMFSPFDFKKYEDIFDFGFEEFIIFTKAHLVSLFGEIALDTIRISHKIYGIDRTHSNCGAILYGEGCLHPFQHTKHR